MSNKFVERPHVNILQTISGTLQWNVCTWISPISLSNFWIKESIFPCIFSFFCQKTRTVNMSLMKTKYTTTSKTWNLIVTLNVPLGVISQPVCSQAQHFWAEFSVDQFPAVNGPASALTPECVPAPVCLQRATCYHLTHHLLEGCTPAANFPSVWLCSLSGKSVMSKAMDRRWEDGKNEDSASLAANEKALTPYLSIYLLYSFSYFFFLQWNIFLQIFCRGWKLFLLCDEL